ncbi:hypothetical protein [Clostridium sporogenes]|uniref:hypothetical protein n=1 Tax=Clostridium sporogenes TaxID=1509 RepID=UPI00128D6E06|nr:hypothetical protein [Clostridium sporogenes]
MPTLLSENIVGTVVVSTLLGPIFGTIMVGISNIIFNSFGIGQEVVMIIFATKILEAIIIGIINYKNNKKITRFIITILILSLIIPFIGIMTSKYTYQYGTEVYNFSEYIKSSINMYLEFLKKDYLNNLKTYILSFVISMPIITIFNKKI